MSQKFILSLCCCTVLLLSCATREPVTEGSFPAGDEGRPEEPVTSSGQPDPDQMDPNSRLLYDSRSRLSDQYVTLSNDMPEEYLLSESLSGDNVDIYAGFRIQLISTRNVAEADSLKNRYDAWADTTFQPVAPASYIFFRQPYYRVRIGDFHDRDEASLISRYMKSRYPDAWVVHDRINPERVLPDSAEFQLRVQSP